MDIEDNFVEIPDRISGLKKLAFNLWWSWHPEAKDLFEMLSRTAWELSMHNPVKMLNFAGSEAFRTAVDDPRFLRHYDSVIAKFEAEMNTYTGWFCDNVADPKAHKVAYFSAEYGLHYSLPFYAGGLGFLAGDFLKECSDLGVPVVAVGFMYPEGYFRQRISPDGWQGNECEILDRENAPISKVFKDDGSFTVKVPLIDPPIHLEVWKVEVGKVSLYLIDTSTDINEPWNRCISDRLYIGDPEQRLRQEVVLGIGGMQVLRSQGIRHSILHLNEGHPAFAILERSRQLVESGMDCRDALNQVRATTLFTTHTTVPAGNDVFPFQLVEKYFSSYLPALGLGREDFLKLGSDAGDPLSRFNMTVFALRMSAYHNAVSQRHAEVANMMWQHLWMKPDEDNVVHLDYVTNGVHVPTWIAPEIKALFNKYLGDEWQTNHDNPSIWELIDDIPDEELWRIHQVLKMKLIAKIRDSARQKWRYDLADPRAILASGVLMDTNVLTIGFARRFATYKRATLILNDAERLKRLMNDERKPIQIIFAGKAHPDDNPAKRMIQQVYNATKDQSFGGRIAFLEDYNEQLARYLVQGVDVWLNNPLPPLEASGTSGMKAELNGVPHLSILDGWWIEGFNGNNGWAFQGSDDEKRDEKDARAIYEILEKEAIPQYYKVSSDGIPHHWIRIMKESLKRTGPLFCTRRMAKEYTTRFYMQAMKSVLDNGSVRK
jgi:starch phosphorylase